MGKKVSFWSGIAILIVLVVGYFVKVRVDSGVNFIYLDSLLGIMIFHNPFILGLYILGAVVLIVKGRKQS